MNKSQKVTNLHNQAMEIAEEGYFTQREGDKTTADKHFKTAYELEKSAAMLLIDDFDIEPTRSILFKGAAQLAFNFGDYRAMEQMIGFALTGNPDKATTLALKQLLNEAELETENDSFSSIVRYKTLSKDLRKEVDDFVEFLFKKYAKTA
ncbi:MAG: hypothetical protein AB8G11_26190 [Saprospiraceae bacterium]